MVLELAYDYFVGIGRSRTVLGLQLLWLAALVPTLIVGARLDGARGVAVAQVLAVLFVVVPAFCVSLARTGIDVAAIGRQAALPALSGAVIVAVGSVTTTAFSTTWRAWSSASRSRLRRVRSCCCRVARSCWDCSTDAAGSRRSRRSRCSMTPRSHPNPCWSTRESDLAGSSALFSLGSGGSQRDSQAGGRSCKGSRFVDAHEPQMGDE